MRYFFVLSVLFVSFLGAGCADLAGFSETPSPNVLHLNTVAEGGEVAVPIQDPGAEAPVGSRVKRDTKGCLVSSGYAWCETFQRCQLETDPCETPVDTEDLQEVEEWVRDSIEMYLLEQTALSRFRGLDFSLEGLTKMECLGCWVVTSVFLDEDDPSLRRIIVFKFSEWQIIEAAVAEERSVPLSTEVCLAQGGRIVVVVDEVACPADLTPLGRISDAVDFSICCVP